MASDPILSLDLTIITLRFCKYFLPVIETYTDSTQTHTVRTFKEVTACIRVGFRRLRRSTQVYALSSYFEFERDARNWPVASTDLLTAAFLYPLPSLR